MPDWNLTIGGAQWFPDRFEYIDSGTLDLGVPAAPEGCLPVGVGEVTLEPFEGILWPGEEHGS